jgi:hypothetical protein
MGRGWIGLIEVGEGGEKEEGGDGGDEVAED